MGGADTGIPPRCRSYGDRPLHGKRLEERISEKEGESRVQASLTPGHVSVASLEPRDHSYLLSLLIDRSRGVLYNTFACGQYDRHHRGGVENRPHLRN